MNRIAVLGLLGAAALAGSCFVPYIEVAGAGGEDPGTGGGGAGGGAEGGGGGSPAPCESLVEASVWPTGCAACIAASELACTWASYCLGSVACQQAQACFENDFSPGGRVRCLREGSEGWDSYGSALEIAQDVCLQSCFGRHWSCVEAWSWPPPLASEGFFTLRFRDEIDEGVLPGVPARACAATDSDCSDPVAEVVSGVAGAAAMSVGLPFDGFFEADAVAGYPPLRLVFTDIIADDAVDVRVPSASLLASLASSVGATIDPMRAQLLVLVGDCTETLAPGIVLAVTPLGMTAEVAHYLDGVAIDVGAEATNREGRGVVFDLPPGSATLRAQLDDSDVARRVLDLRAGLNIVDLFPLQQ